MAALRVFRSFVARRVAIGTAATTALVFGGGVAVALAQPSYASAFTTVDHHPAELPWPHKSTLLGSFDHFAIRRGYQVYKQVCAACHSCKFVSYRHLVNVCLTDEEARAEAAENVVIDEDPDSQGNPVERPGRLYDQLPNPYPNKEAAQAANNGKEPPDFSYLVLAREKQEDYIFHLLLGYYDAPAGCELDEGLHYNPYYPGHAISMARALYPEAMEYDDGTPATPSQMAKDVVTYMSWCAQPEHETRRRFGLKGLVGLGLGLVAFWYYKRHVWSIVKTRKIVYKNRPKPRNL